MKHLTFTKTPDTKLNYDSKLKKILIHFNKKTQKKQPTLHCTIMLELTPGIFIIINCIFRLKILGV